MTAATVPPEVVAYLAAVRAALVDLPEAERDDLLAEVEASLVETTAETVGPIAARLGPPDQFAAELRAAAGFTPAVAPADAAPVRQRLQALAHAIAAQPAVGAARRRATELAPIWWVVRGYLAVGTLALALGAGWSTRLPLLPRLGNGTIALLLVAVAAALSVAVGLRGRSHNRARRRLTVAVNVALLVAAVPVVARVADGSAFSSLVRAAYTPAPTVELPQGLTYDGTPVDNIYPFSRDGRLLHDVLLYDGAGRALDIAAGGDDIDRRVVRSRRGKAVLNAFPIRYYEPRTRTVAHPNAIPPVSVPRIATPPLETHRRGAKRP